MRLKDLTEVVLDHIKSRPKDWAYSALGIVFSVGLINLSLAVGVGLQVNVIEHALPLDSIEVEPQRGVRAGPEEAARGFLDSDVALFAGIRGVSDVFPKQKALFKARMWGGEGLFGKRLYAEAFFDGVQAELVQDDLERARKQTVPDGFLKREIPCVSHEECFGGSQCEEGVCATVDSTLRFQNYEPHFPCKTEGDCALETTCVAGRCVSAVCAPGTTPCGDGFTCVSVPCSTDTDCGDGGGKCGKNGICRIGVCHQRCERREEGDIPTQDSCPMEKWCVEAPCQTAADCEVGECVEGRCTEGGVCAGIPCRLDSYDDLGGGSASAAQGILLSYCGEGGTPAPGGACEFPLSCPSGTYCRVGGANELTGMCDRTVPVLLNPLMLELLNAATRSSGTGLSLSGETAVLGLQFRVEAGVSTVRQAGEPIQDRQVMRVEAVASSDIPGLLGGTVPLPVVEGLNARFYGRESSKEYQSLVLRIDEGAELQSILEEVRGLGADLSSRSRMAERLASLVFWVVILFVSLGGVVLALSAVNIGHTLLMVVEERRREFGVMMALGATRSTIRKMVLVESISIGAVGGILGVLCAVGLGELAEWGLRASIALPGLLPNSLLAFQSIWVTLSIGVALLFSVLGAWAPAFQASRVDPSVLFREER